MNKYKNGTWAMTLTQLGVASVVIAGSLTAAPAFAQGSADSHDNAASATSPLPRASTADQLLVDRINELVAAYDADTRTFDASSVSAATLESDEGRAFVAALSLGAADDFSASSELDSMFMRLRDELVAAGAPTTAGTVNDPGASGFLLAPGVSVVFPDSSERLSGGADPWPYVQLTNPEQQAMVTGGSAALVAAICALLGPETAGVGCGVGAAVILMIVGILVANGVCRNNREMRIYPLVGVNGFSCQ